MPDAGVEWAEHLKAAMRHCGICGKSPMFNWARRVGQVCESCESRAVDSKSNRIVIEQHLQEREGMLVIQNPQAFFTVSFGDKTVPGSPCEEVNKSRRCWVDGIECQIWEGRFGGVGLVVSNPSFQIKGR